MNNNLLKLKQLIGEEEFARVTEVLSIIGINASEEQECDIKRKNQSFLGAGNNWKSISSEEELIAGIDYRITSSNGEYHVFIYNYGGYGEEAPVSFVALSASNGDISYNWSKCLTNLRESLRVYQKREYVQNGVAQFGNWIKLNSEFKLTEDGGSRLELTDDYSGITRFIKSDNKSIEYSDSTGKHFSDTLDRYPLVIRKQLKKIKRSCFCDLPKEVFETVFRIYERPINDYVESKDDTLVFETPVIEDELDEGIPYTDETNYSNHGYRAYRRLLQRLRTPKDRKKGC